MAILSAIGIDDVYFWAGFACLWVGFRQVYSPAAPIAGGVVLMALGLYSATRGS